MVKKLKLHTSSKRIFYKTTILVGALFLSYGLIFSSADNVSAHPKGLLFPLIGNGTFSNDFNASRGAEKHNATDIIAPKMTKIVAATGGTVTYMPIPEPSFGYMITIKDDDGFTYEYIHMNNDRVGTDDGSGGPYLAYAPD